MKLLVYLKLVTCSLSVNMLKLTNLYRKYYNMEELKPIPPLQMASDLQANTMCKELKVTHEGIPGRETLRDRLEAFNFTGINIGENIAKQENDDYKEVFKVWIKSKLHRKNILGDYTYSAVTTCRGQDDKRYWVQVFGKDLSNSNIRELRQTATDTIQDKEGDSFHDKIGGGLRNQLLDYFSVLKSKNGSGESKPSEITPISIENTLSISRRFSKPSTITKTEIVTKSPDLQSTPSVNPKLPQEDFENPENMEFLFKEGEDIKKILNKLPTNFHLSFKGNYKKYIAYKNPEEVKNKADLTEPKERTFSKPKGKETNSLEKYIGKMSRPAKPLTLNRSSTSITSVEKASSSSSVTSTIDLNDKKYEELLKSIIEKLKNFEKKPNTEQSFTSIDSLKPIESPKTTSSTQSSLEHPKATSLTIDLTEIVPISKTSISSQSIPVSISSILSTSSIPASTVIVSDVPNTTTEIIYKTVYADKNESTPKISLPSISQPAISVSNDVGNINILTITKKSNISLSPVYKTTKIGSISVLNNNSEFRTITVTILKDSIVNNTKDDREITNIPNTIPTDQVKNNPEINEKQLIDILKQPKSSSFIENKDSKSLLDFNSNMKKLFKDLIKEKRNRKLFRSSSIDKDTESKLKEYINSLICDKEINPNVLEAQCNVIDIGEPIVD